MSDEVAFLSAVAARVKRDFTILDFGAGAGDLIGSPQVDQRLVDFRGRCRQVVGCDVDPSVLHNPGLDAADVIEPGAPLAYPDDHFDLIVSRCVFEHLEDPRWAARELLRVLKPGGAIYAVTTNRGGYVAIGARLIPRALHKWVLRRLQPGREESVFSAYYRLNTARAAKSSFAGAAVSAEFAFGPPGYVGRGRVGRLIAACHEVLPRALAPQLHLVIRKPAA